MKQRTGQPVAPPQQQTKAQQKARLWADFQAWGPGFAPINTKLQQFVSQYNQERTADEPTPPTLDEPPKSQQPF